MEPRAPSTAPEPRIGKDSVAPATVRAPRETDLRFSVALVAVAVSAAGFAIAFRAGIALVLRAAGSYDIVSAMKAAPLWARVLCPTLGALVAGGIGVITARRPSGRGVADVMEAVVLGRVRLSVRTTLLKSLASFVAIASGGSLGREGPLIQFGGVAGKFVSERLGVSSRRTRLLIAAGSAAGFAAAYNTPFAAVLFVLEVVTGVVVLDAILPALVATVIACALTRSVVGEGPIYGQRAFHLLSLAELVAFAGLGVVAAFGTRGFMALLAFGERRFRVVPLPWRAALGGALAGLVILALPEVAGNGYEPLNVLMDEEYTLQFAAVLLVGKCIATALSVSSGSPGGVFTPTLLVGGAIGFLFANAVSFAGAHLGAAGGYALVGMAAATAAATHAPLMAAVMAFELSGDYAVALPLVLSTAIATFVSRRLGRDSVYTAELREQGVRWELTMEGRRLVD